MRSCFLKQVALCWVLFIYIFIVKSEKEARRKERYAFSERQRFDGWYNNLAHPDWGSLESQLVRKTPPSYSDGVYMIAGRDRPSPRVVSQSVFKGDDGIPSERNLTALFSFFGQVVSSEILMAGEPGCPIEFHKIEIDKCDDMYDKKCQGGRYMPFHRALYDSKTGQSPNSPREQINLVTSWIDGSFVYSTSEAWVNSMRSFKNGTFRRNKDNNYPPKNTERAPLMNSPPAKYLGMLNPERMFLVGDPRSNQNPALLAFGILFFRWHNVLASRIHKEHPDWSDEEIFHRARQWVIASMQNIIIYEFLPALIGEEVTEYTGYKPDLHPGISHVFQSAAFRFGHSLVPPGMYRRDGQCNFKKTQNGYPALRLCSSWWESDAILPEFGMEEIFMGLASQIGEKEDIILCSDVRDKLFGPVDFSRRDLGSLNIMRGRDNGLPDYNTVRKCYQLPMVSTWSEINPSLFKEQPDLFKNVEELYGDIDNIDLFVGGMLETKDGKPGPLFTKIIKQEFEKIRDADRFWFENKRNGCGISNVLQECV